MPNYYAFFVQKVDNNNIAPWVMGEIEYYRAGVKIPRTQLNVHNQTANGQNFTSNRASDNDPYTYYYEGTMKNPLIVSHADGGLIDEIRCYHGSTWSGTQTSYLAKEINFYTSTFQNGTDESKWPIESKIPKTYSIASHGWQPKVSFIKNVPPTKLDALAGIISNDVFLSGEEVTLQWSASTDPDGDSITYEIEFSSDGFAWTIEATGITETSKKIALRNINSKNCYYRVRAKDSKAAYSAYIQSPAFTICKQLVLIETSSQVKSYKNNNWINI